MRYKTTKTTRPRKLRQQARRKRNLVLGGVALAAVLTVILLIALGPKPAAAGEYISITPQAWPQADGKSLGPAGAAVVITEYADYQCPYCKIYHDDIQPQLVRDYVETGLVRYEYRHLIVIDGNVGGNESRRAAQAAECAAEQNRFWDYSNMLYANQNGEGTGAFSDTRLKAFSAALGLDETAFNRCLSSSRAAGSVLADERAAGAAGLNSTPSLLVNGVRVANPLNYDQVKAAIDAALGTPAN